MAVPPAEGDLAANGYGYGSDDNNTCANLPSRRVQGSLRDRTDSLGRLLVRKSDFTKVLDDLPRIRVANHAAYAD
jgi:hypothetical protein